VSDTVKKAVYDELDRLRPIPVSKHPYFCNEYNPMIYPFLNETFNCINTSTFFSMNTPYPGMDYLGEYVVPLRKIETENSVLIGVITASAVLIALCLVMLGAIVYYKDSHSIRSASPIFCIIIIFGGIMTYAGVILYVLPTSDAVCNIRYWLLALGYSTLAGSLVVKNFRIWLIFDNPELKKIKITNSQLMPWVGGINFIVLVLLILLAIPQLGNLRVEAQYGPSSFLEKYDFQNVCSFSDKTHVILYLLLGVFAALIMVGVFVSWKIRIVDLDEFNESKPIANSLYAALFSIFVIVPLLVVPHSENSETIIISSAGLFITTMTLAILFIPKFYRIYVFGANSSEMFSSAKSAIAESRSAKSKESGNAASFEYESKDSSDDSSEMVVCAPESLKPIGDKVVHAQFDSDDEDVVANHNLSIDHSNSSSDENNNNNNEDTTTKTTSED
ncbi:hypothetical protein SAMD00019534_069730, partial [Acytostelium subglobosum LB1]|uniref:hypothetical protein n=1 Tax=Acytostelium subglobosum LB1 TaxID=1410327 RepID=UPI000645098C